ncbi:MAG: ABC transporter ATP-binding protein [Clostridia bacterium]|nr:ABC transporter ATP-binding protein [Clostridia bacterium]
MQQNKIEKPFIKLTEVVKEFSNERGKFTALDRINLSISKGEYVGIVGKSGSGKTTLLNMLTGIDRPTSGDIVIDNRVITSLSESRMAVWRGRNIGVVFQFFQLLPTLTVLENVMLPMDFCNSYPYTARKTRALSLLDKVGMKSHADKIPSSLSGGEQQRVAIARALANDPQIIAADEPTGNLDSRTAGMIFGIFDKLVEEGKTVIIITHDKEVGMRVNRCVTVADGKITEDIPTERDSSKYFRGVN